MSLELLNQVNAPAVKPLHDKSSTGQSQGAKNPAEATLPPVSTIVLPPPQFANAFPMASMDSLDPFQGPINLPSMVMGQMEKTMNLFGMVAMAFQGKAPNNYDLGHF